MRLQKTFSIVNFIANRIWSRLINVPLPNKGVLTGKFIKIDKRSATFITNSRVTIEIIAISLSRSHLREMPQQNQHFLQLQL